MYKLACLFDFTRPSSGALGWGESYINAPKGPPSAKIWNPAFLIRRIRDGINPPSGPPAYKKFLEFSFSGLEPPFRSLKYESVKKDYGGKGGAAFEEIYSRLDFYRDRKAICIVKGAGDQSWC